MLIGERCNIDAYFHINALLIEVEHEIIFGECIKS